jgi:hypothetical protein
MGWYSKVQRLKELGIRIVLRKGGTTPTKKAPPPAPKPVPKPPIPIPTPEAPKPITYTMNDPDVSSLVKIVYPPTVAIGPKFTVVGYKGGGFTSGSVEGQAASVFYTVGNQINAVNAVVQKKMVNWAATKSLNVVPRAGVMQNALYDRRSLAFFYFKDNHTGRTVYTADSTEIVAHEFGHSVLDSYRPDLWSVASIETWSFHESFGDFMAMMATMQHDEVLNYMLSQTGGDIRQPNVVTQLAEQFGEAVLDRGFLRTAINNFKYVNPVTLPANGPEDVLVARPHSFSRVLTGALYDCLALIYEKRKASGETPLLALKTARDVVFRYTMEAIQRMPNSLKIYSGFAKTLISFEAQTGNAYQGEFIKAFSDRNILVMSALTADPEPRRRCVRLSDHVANTMLNPLHDCVVDVTDDTPLALEAAKKMVDYLYIHKLVGDGAETPWEISDGKLVRSHFACKCGNRMDKDLSLR